MNDEEFQRQLIKKILSYLEGRTTLADLLLMRSIYIPTDHNLKHTIMIFDDIHTHSYSFLELEEKIVTVLDSLTRRESNPSL